MEADNRTAHVVLTRGDGAVLGRLAPIKLEVPWWPEVASIVAAVRARDGLDIVVLRLLHADRPRQPGGNVTYLAEVAEAGAVEPWIGAIDDDPRRLSYARPGGPAADVAWACGAMAANGIAAAGRPEQIRTWNLSSLWRFPSNRGPLWLKVVPPFFAHEGRLLGKLSEYPTPRVLASDGPRLLMFEIPGEDLYEAATPVLLGMVELLVRIQADWIGRVDELLGLGVPDWRPPVAAGAIAAVVERAAQGLTASDRALIDRFVAKLPDRFAAVEECGLPSTLVHGDFHPGNCRGSVDAIVLLDFGDTMVGHPLLDMPAFLASVPASARAAVRATWAAAWRAAVPRSDPERAGDLIAPIAAARQAAIYQGFLDAIEPAEHPYHRNDPRRWLERTARILRREPQPPALRRAAGQESEPGPEGVSGARAAARRSAS